MVWLVRGTKGQTAGEPSPLCIPVGSGWGTNRACAARHQLFARFLGALGGKEHSSSLDAETLGLNPCDSVNSSSEKGLSSELGVGCLIRRTSLSNQLMGKASQVLGRYLDPA